jgi:hypothetical protein
MKDQEGSSLNLFVACSTGTGERGRFVLGPSANAPVVPHPIREALPIQGVSGLQPELSTYE